VTAPTYPRRYATVGPALASARAAPGQSESRGVGLLLPQSQGRRCRKRRILSGLSIHARADATALIEKRHGLRWPVDVLGAVAKPLLLLDRCGTLSEVVSHCCFSSAPGSEVAAAPSLRSSWPSGGRPSGRGDLRGCVFGTSRGLASIATPARCQPGRKTLPSGSRRVTAIAVVSARVRLAVSAGGRWFREWPVGWPRRSSSLRCQLRRSRQPWDLDCVVCVLSFGDGSS
jgi:hypothetical protein